MWENISSKCSNKSNVAAYLLVQMSKWSLKNITINKSNFIIFICKRYMTYQIRLYRHYQMVLIVCNPTHIKKRRLLYHIYISKVKILRYIFNILYYFYGNMRPSSIFLALSLNNQQCEAFFLVYSTGKYK